MITHLAKSLSSYFLSHSFISEKEYHIYTYCFEIILSGIIAWGSIISIAIVTQNTYITILYIFSFFMFRHLAGGYHAKTHLNCYLISLTSYLLFLVISNLVPIEYYLTISYSFMFIASLILFFLAPIDHKNNPFF